MSTRRNSASIIIPTRYASVRLSWDSKRTACPTSTIPARTPRTATSCPAIVALQAWAATPTPSEQPSSSAPSRSASLKTTCETWSRASSRQPRTATWPRSSSSLTARWANSPSPSRTVKATGPSRSSSTTEFTRRSPMPTVEIDLPSLHATQRQVVAESKRFNALCCGRRWGKTLLATTRLAEVALQGFPVALFSPTYRVLGDTFRELVKVLAPVTVRKSEVEKRIEIKGGGSVEAWSLDDENSGRSRRYKHVVIDEAAHIPNIEAAFNGSIRPTL